MDGLILLLSIWILFLAAKQRRSGYFETLMSKLLITEGAEDPQRAQGKDWSVNIIIIYLDFISRGAAVILKRW